jgi:hypothetical protein
MPEQEIVPASFFINLFKFVVFYKLFITFAVAFGSSISCLPVDD